MISKSFHTILKLVFRKLANIINLGLISPSLLTRNIYFGPSPEISGIKYIEIGDNFYVRSRLWMDAIRRFNSQSFIPNITIGKNFSASNGLHIAAINKIIIGDDCLFGSNIILTDHSHGNGGSDEIGIAPIAKKLHSKAGVSVGNRVWLGDNTVILPGSVVGDDVIVGANSVVRGILPSRSVCAGNPCKVIRIIDGA